MTNLTRYLKQRLTFKLKDKSDAGVELFLLSGLSSLSLTVEPASKRMNCERWTEGSLYQRLALITVSKCIVLTIWTSVSRGQTLVCMCNRSCCKYCLMVTTIIIEVQQGCGYYLCVNTILRQ